MKKNYRVKVVEWHVDFVWVEADSEAEAEANAYKISECRYECLYSSEATGETEEM
ncbi:MAG: hypothetical protein GY928_31950 [Colwellia sp.]|nr:hypothetical protein [Colwellia sp.]